MTKQNYLSFIENSIELNLQQCNHIIDSWKSNMQKNELFGYSTTAYPANFAELLGFMYQHTGDETYAAKAIEMLLVYEELKRIFPPEYYKDRVEYSRGLPPISDFISMYTYPRAVNYIAGSTSLTPDKRKILQQGAADCANFLMIFPEWGPMNRAAIRAETFFACHQVVPEHPDAPSWMKMADMLLSDNYQRWEAEDATGYHALWLHSLFHIAEAKNDDDFFRSAIPRYYLDYFAHLITPAGNIADFGDAVWYSDWFSRFIPLFEKGAVVYREPLYRWAAQQIFDSLQRTANTLTGYYGAVDFLTDYDWYQKPVIANPFFTLAIVDAFRWADEGIVPQPPKPVSRQVMDDLVGKKLVFRDGVDPKSTWMMLNYQDEGDSNFLGREYLRTNICVEEEKMHHGHSDENAVNTLFYNGSILLHDSGYRDHLPSSEYGGFRADYHHNRVVVRKNKRWIKIEGDREEQSVWEFLRNSGMYRPVRTKLIDFMRFQHVDYSRSRVTDTEMGYEWDRTVVFHKPNQFFVIVDSINAIREDYFTCANLWHSQKILTSGDRWFDTTIDNIRSYKNDPGNNLLVYYPLFEYERSSGSFALKRHSQPEQCMYEIVSSHYYPGQREVFVTVLFPHKNTVDPTALVEKFALIETDKFPSAIGLTYKNGDATEYFCIRNDLTMDYIQQNLRPRYSYNPGKVTYGPFTTDAYFLHGIERGRSIHYAASNMTRILYHDQVLMESLKASSGLQLDRGPIRANRMKWRGWEDDVQLKNV